MRTLNFLLGVALWFGIPALTYTLLLWILGGHVGEILSPKTAVAPTTPVHFQSAGLNSTSDIGCKSDVSWSFVKPRRDQDDVNSSSVYGSMIGTPHITWAGIFPQIFSFLLLFLGPTDNRHIVRNMVELLNPVGLAGRQHTNPSLFLWKNKGQKLVV